MTVKINQLQLRAFYESNRNAYYLKRQSGDAEKWDILPKLNKSLAKYETVTADNFGEIIAKVIKGIPNHSSFAGLIDMEYLDLLVETKNGYQVFQDLWLATPENIASEINSANAVASLLLHDKKLSNSTYGFILAVKDCYNFSIYSDWIAKKLAEVNNINMPTLQGEKYKLLNDSASYIGGLMQEDNLTDGLEYKALGGQDFIWVTMNGDLHLSVEQDVARQYIDRGSIRVDETARFRTHVEVARLFGKNYKGHQSATISLNDDWIIWFPKLYKNTDWDNQISTDGRTITMKYLPGGQYGKDMEFHDNGRCIVFGHKIDKQTSEKYYEFVGVFTRLEGTSAYATCERVADTLQIDGNGGFTIPSGCDGNTARI